jgi:hypothetical protein
MQLQHKSKVYMINRISFQKPIHIRAHARRVKPRQVPLVILIALQKNVFSNHYSFRRPEFRFSEIQSSECHV